jgi:protein involved in polysaccharide export with SLBB domain
MKKIVLLICIILSQQSPGQKQPDYNERLHPFITDSLFLQQQTEIGATEGIIEQDEYILAPGDKLFISIIGYEEVTFNGIINQEGYLYIPKVGGIDLRAVNLKEGKDKIIEQINRYYKNVDVFISLYDFRKIKVSLIGDVKKPSSYVISGNSRLIDLIMKSEGFNTTSDLRNIKIKSRKGNENSYDLLTFLRLGDKIQNPLLMEGDVVIVTKVDRTVAISGEVMYPGSYEYVEGETAGDLINLAGGLLSKARQDSIEFIRFTSDGMKQTTEYYSSSQIIDDNLTLKDKDHVVIRSIPEYLEEKYVVIEGYVNFPGYYKVSENTTKLSDIIIEAGGFRKDASLIESTLFREIGTEEYDAEYERLKLIPRSDMTEDEYDYVKAKSRQRRGNVVLDFEKLFVHSDSSEDVLLKKGDRINVPQAKNYIIMIGQVISPGNIIYKENLNYINYIELAGGFGWRALENDVRIVKAKTGEWIDADEETILEPGDTIWVPEDPPAPKFWDIFMDSLTILAQLAAVIAAVAAVIAVSR